MTFDYALLSWCTTDRAGAGTQACRHRHGKQVASSVWRATFRRRGRLSKMRPCAATVRNPLDAKRIYIVSIGLIGSIDSEREPMRGSDHEILFQQYARS